MSAWQAAYLGVFREAVLQIEDEPPTPPLSPLPSLVALLRGIARVGLILIVVVIGLVDYWLTVRKDRHSRRKSQAEWLHRCGRRVARLLSIRVETQGSLPREGL